MMKRFLFLLVCLASALTCQAQTVSHTFRNVTLAEALTTINNEQSAYTLTFVNNDLERLQVSATLKRLSVPEAVEQLCKGQPVRMKVKGRNIYVQYHKPRKVEQMVVSGYVYDHLTHVELVGATVQLLAADSTALDTCEARSLWMQGEKSGYNAFYLFAVPKLPKDYLLRVSYVGYEPTYFPLSLKNLHKREYSRELPPLYMKRQRNTLQEVQVTASKVMFYYRGDTLVYNADAFQLAEGSMLDALIKQMPGVELKKNGQIYHNGKFVKSLLLNGKEFFRGDNTVMLDNLPAYTVKEVKVYDREGSEGLRQTLRASRVAGQQRGERQVLRHGCAAEEGILHRMARQCGGRSRSLPYEGRFGVLPRPPLCHALCQCQQPERQRHAWRKQFVQSACRQRTADAAEGWPGLQH